MSQQNVELADLGIEAEEVRKNWSEERLYEQAVRSGEGDVAKGGALLVKTGKHTGRSAKDKFTVQEVAVLSTEKLKFFFGNSQVNQLFNKLSEGGLIYRNRHGRYCFAVLLREDFIKCQLQEAPLFDWRKENDQSQP